jgi:ubiquinone/menaquinone biosynthesis C-methylase UbiE
MKHQHPVFAWFYELATAHERLVGAAEMRGRLVGKLDGRILEVGAGNGLNFHHYRRTADVVAIEPDPYMWRRAERRTRTVGARVRLLGGEGEALPFKPESFDTVVSCMVLCSIPDAACALEEFRRVLKPRGTLHFAEHVRARAPWAAAAQDAISPLWARMFAGCHPNRDTVGAIERAGFRVEALATGVGGIVVRGHALAV